MQVDNVYRPTEDTTGRHRHLLIALADAALKRAQSAMQPNSPAGQTPLLLNILLSLHAVLLPGLILCSLFLCLGCNFPCT